MTDQRKIMLDVILEGRWSSCKEIYYEASKRDPGDRQGNGVPG